MVLVWYILACCDCLLLLCWLLVGCVDLNGCVSELVLVGSVGFVSVCMLALGLVDLVWFRDDLRYGYLMFYLDFSVIVCDLLGFGCMAIVFAC